MDAAGRKRKSRSGSVSRSESPVSHRTRQGLALAENGNGHSMQPKPVGSTPRKPRKRVRFSDPGPRLNDGASMGSTGLTPSMCRTSFQDPGAPFSQPGDRTPGRRARRRSAPTPRFRRSFDPVAPFDEKSTKRVMQFTPLRQILDTRTQRRIRRIGLSDEMNAIDRENRDAVGFEKTLHSLIQERDALKHELAAMRQTQWGCEDHSSSMSPRARFAEHQAQTERLRDEVSVSSDTSLHDPISVNDDVDTFMLNESAEGTILVSNSPVFRGTQNCLSPATDSLMVYKEQRSNADAPPQTPVMEATGQSDIDALTLDLEIARNEKKLLFDACRSRIPAFDDTAISDVFHQPSPPPDFFDHLLSLLTVALTRASNAAQALEGISQEVTGLGFSGTDADEVVSDMRSHFRAARLQLERAIPGETADVGLEDGKKILTTLVRRVESLVEELGSERNYHHGSLSREKALRGQFDSLLARYETAANKVDSLEESIASSAGDMLHTRMRMQDLEREGHEKTIGIDRLNGALTKYREDVKSLERIVSALEKENMAVKEEYTRQIADLEVAVANERRSRSAAEISVSEHESRIRELEETVEQNRIRACDLTAEVEALEKEHQQAIERLESNANEEAQRHDADTGHLNVRVADLTTSLEGARTEAQRLQQINTGLEEQLHHETSARDNILDKWAADQARSFAFMKDAVSSERRRAKVRAANWELRSDDLMSDGTTVAGSEPITPVSMTRFVDVEIGRGKNRRRIDSGVGILTEDELEDESMAELRRGLDSDVDLPSLADI